MAPPVPFPREVPVPAGANAAEVGFGRVVTDAEVLRLLERHGVRPYEVGLVVGEGPGLYEGSPAGASPGLIARARRAKAEAARTAPCFRLAELGVLLRQDPHVRPAPGERDVRSRMLLSQIEAARAAPGRLLRGEPAVYSLRVVGTAAALRGLAADPLVRQFQVGRIGEAGPWAGSPPQPPEQPLVLPAVDSLSNREVKRRLERYAREGIPGCEGYLRNAGLGDTPVRVAPGTMVGGVAFRTRTETDSLRESGALGPTRVRVFLAVENRTGRRVEVPVRGCTASLRVYRDPGGRVPARPGELAGGQCMAEPSVLVLGPGESREFETGLEADRFLQDSLPPGRYHFAATFRLRNRTLEIPAGAAVLRTGLEPLRYRAAVRVRGDTLVGGATVVNTGKLPVQLEFGGCGLQLRAYRTAYRTGGPAWRSDRRGEACILMLHGAMLAPGDSLSRPLRLRVQVPQVLGDSLPDGRYHFAATLGLNFGLSPEVPAGEAVLAARRKPLPAERVVGVMTFRPRTVVTRTAPRTVEVTLTGTLTHAGGAVERFSADCPLVLHAYRSRARRDAAPRSGRADWSSRLRCGPEMIEFSLDRGDTRTFRVRATARDILGDSLPPGRYHFAVAVHHEQQRALLAAGSAPLAP